MTKNLTVRLPDELAADTEALARVSAPSAEFSGEEFYPDLVTKAALLLVRLAKNHPLPDGNKRVAWVAMRYFLILNDIEWSNYPEVADAEQAVVAVASGEWDEAMFADWLRERLEASEA